MSEHTGIRRIWLFLRIVWRRWEPEIAWRIPAKLAWEVAGMVWPARKKPQP